MSTCNEIINQYATWFTEHSVVKEGDQETCIVHLPFRDPSNDMIQILIKKISDEEIILSDLGNSHGYLFLQGLSSGNKKIKYYERVVSNSYQVQNINDELILKTTSQELNISMMNMISAINEIKSLVNLKRELNPFKSDFRSLANHTFHTWDLTPSLDQKFEGKSGKTHPIDFVFNHKIYLDTLTASGPSMGASRLNREIEKAIDFSTTFGTNGHKFIVALDDREDDYRNWPEYKLNILRFANAIPIYWDENRIELAELLQVRNLPEEYPDALDEYF